MPVQQQMATYAGRHGARVAAANAEHRDKPIDTGNRRLPGGIKKGIAKIQSAYTKQQTEEKGKIPKGETFFRISAATIGQRLPDGRISKEHNGQKIDGIITSQVIPLCDIPEKKTQEYTTEAVSFSQNWFDFQNLFKMLGVMPPTGPQYDVTPQMNEAQKMAAGLQIEAYYFAAMKSLVEKPTLIEFSTRSWKGPKRPNETEEQYRNREPMVFEEWHGLTDMNVQHDPAASVTQSPPNGQAASHSAPFEEPPRGELVMPDTQPVESVDIGDEVTMLVEVAMSDPNGDTEDGAAAGARLEDLAWANGWTKEQTGGAANWEAVGNMALDPAPTVQTQTPTAHPQPPPGATAVTVPHDTTPVIGGKFKFTKRTKDGTKLKNSKGEDLPPQDVEVLTVDPTTKTCTLKTVKDGKTVVDLRSKEPTKVKWEWLE